MRFLVLTDDPTAARVKVCRASIVQAYPGSQVLTCATVPRLGKLDADVALTAAGLDIDGFRWVDLSLALAPVVARWAVLPWILDAIAPQWNASSSPLVVVDDTFFYMGAPHESWVPGGAVAARAHHVDGTGNAWGGCLPGYLSMPGALGVGANEMGSLANWWRERALEALAGLDSDPEQQPWWDLPVGVHVLADPRVRVASGTLAELPGEELDVPSTGPLLVDFAGFEPRAPWEFGHTGSRSSRSHRLPQWYMSACEQYVEAIDGVEVGDAVSDRAVAGWNQPLPGITVTPQLRQWYRSLLVDRSEGANPSPELPPNPYVAGQERAFVELLSSNGPGGRTGMGSHVDQVLLRRPDVERAFANPRWKDRREFRNWAWSHGLAEGETSMLTLSEPAIDPGWNHGAGADRVKPFGVNLIGYLDAELGLGVAARRMRSALNAAGVPVADVSYDRTSSKQRAIGAHQIATPYAFNLLLITPDQLPLFVADVGREFLEGHHNIGLWYWETDVVAPNQVEAFGLVDEIWVATEWLTKAFDGHGRTVTVVPSPLVFDQPPAELCTRERHRLDGRFTFLFSFDFLSVAERKNPTGLIEAYSRAFPDPDADTKLLLKAINGNLFPEELAHLEWLAAGREDIEVRDEMLEPADRLGLVAAADCYVSLHRSEGLGLTMAEAMALGTPVIATDYSGNVDFMPPGSALLVPAREVTIGAGHYYPENGHWASPDLDAAAAAMRRVRTDPQLRAALVDRGRRALMPFSFDAVGKVAESALLRSWRELR